MNRFALLITTVAAATLTACGGGGGVDNADVAASLVTASAPDSVAMNAGDSVLMNSTAASTRDALVSMQWTAMRVTPTAPSILLLNSDCATAVKSQTTAKNDGGTDYTASAWSCSVGIKAPVSETDYLYDMVLTASDQAGRTSSRTTRITVKGVPADPTATVDIPDGTVELGLPKSAIAASPNTVVDLDVNAIATPENGLFYQWSQVSGPAVSIGGARTASAGFVLPESIPTGSVLVFRVKAGFAPISSTYDGEAAADVVVQVVPAGN
jgi:hypothetical protein